MVEFRLRAGDAPIGDMKIVRLGSEEHPVGKHAQRFGNDRNMTDRQLWYIETLAQSALIKKFLEVGVYKGVTTTLMAQYGQVVAVDWFKGNPEFGKDGGASGEREYMDRLGGFLHAVKDTGCWDKVTILGGKSDEVLPLLRYDRFGLVLIDANHSEEFAYRDIANCWDLIVPGGWLLLDDFSCATIEEVVKPTVCRAWLRFAAERKLEDSVGYTVDNDTWPNPKLVAIKKT